MCLPFSKAVYNLKYFFFMSQQILNPPYVFRLFVPNNAVCVTFTPKFIQYKLFLYEHEP